MRKRIISVLLVLLMLLMLILYSLPAEASEKYPVRKMRVTVYTYPEGSITASGCEVREGIVAAKKEWMNALVVLYDMDMNFIGYFEVKDTGFGIDWDGDGIGSIQEGTSIDVFRDDLDRCKEWIEKYGDYCYVQIITDAEG
jgi:hypothetical protein